MGSLTLEDFSRPAPDQEETAAMVAAEEAETARLAAYDAGHKAGWDDAMQAAEAEQSRISEDLGRNLQDLGFTYHEARAHVLHAVLPLLSGLLDRVLPTVLRGTLGDRLLAELEPLIDTAGDQPLELVVAEGAGPALRPIIEAATALPVRLREDPVLTEGQALFRLGTNAAEIDLDAALAPVSEAITALATEQKKVLQHG